MRAETPLSPLTANLKCLGSCPTHKLCLMLVLSDCLVANLEILISKSCPADTSLHFPRVRQLDLLLPTYLSQDQVPEYQWSFRLSQRIVSGHPEEETYADTVAYLSLRYSVGSIHC